MLNRPFNAVMARLAIVATALALLMLVAPAVFAATTVSYPENGTDPVDTFNATDEDGDPITWSLDGDDKGDFKISDDGVLEFKSSPNFESPATEPEQRVPGDGAGDQRWPDGDGGCRGSR